MAIRESPGPDEGYGDGTFTNDGCPVEMYGAMPPDVDAAQIVHSAIPPRASVLELGCGPGRITEPLSELGHLVTGVDSSPAMLAELTHTRPVHSDIVSLELTGRFDAVLLASTLINTADPEERTQFLRAARATRRRAAPSCWSVTPPRGDQWKAANRTWDLSGFNCATSFGTTSRSCRRRSSTVWVTRRRGRTSPPKSSATSLLMSA